MESPTSQPVQLYMQLFDLTYGFAKSYALKTVVDLCIPSILAKAGRPLTLSEIADKLPGDNVNIDYLGRIMAFATLNGLFHELREPMASGDAEDSEMQLERETFALTPLSSMLVEEEGVHGKTSFADLTRFTFSHKAMTPWTNFGEAVLSGVEPFRFTFGESMWEACKTDTEWGALFNRAMGDASRCSLDAVIRRYNGFKEIKLLVDVGGGLGASLSSITEAHPGMRGINFDLPNVIAEAPDIPDVKHVSGDMFESVPEGDAIFMKWILHDWGDRECVKILQNCHKSLPRRGKVIIVERVLPAPKEAKPEQYVCDMSMLAKTSGRERTATEWRRVVGTAGFQSVRIIEAPIFHVIEAHKS